MIASLCKRLSLVTMGVLLLCVGLMVAAINGINAISLNTQISESLHMLAGKYSGTDTEESRFERIRDNLPAIPAAGLARTNDYCIIRLDRQGEIREWRSGSAELYTQDSVDEISKALVKLGEGEGRYGQQAYLMESRRYGAMIVLVDISSEEVYEQTLLRTTIGVGVMFWVILSALALLLIRRMLRPVGEAFEKQQRFVWDASHELKTPLAVISANAQVVEKESGRSEYLTYILDEVKQTTALVESLLMLARMDAGKIRQTYEIFDLGMTLARVALPMESLAFEMGKTLRMNLPEDVMMAGNETLVGQMAAILLSNALKHSDDGSIITLSLKGGRRQHRIAVHNTLSYLPPQEQKHVFDRFYRADSSRSRETGGNGLGLSIAMSIAQMHRGTIRVHSTEEEGTTFTAVLYAGKQRFVPSNFI